MMQGRFGTSKDADMSPFEAARRLLSPETARMSLIDKAELVFQDIDLVPLLIQARTCFLCCQFIDPWVRFLQLSASPTCLRGSTMATRTLIA